MFLQTPQVSYRPFSGGPAYVSSLNLQKVLYLNVCTYPVWSFVVAFFLNARFYNLGPLTRFLASAVLFASILIEMIRLYLGYSGNLTNQKSNSAVLTYVPTVNNLHRTRPSVPELAGFWMLTILMQIPLMGFFLFNPYLDSTPTEVTLHVVCFSLLVSELIFGYFALKQASSYAKSIYLSHTKLNKD